VALHRKDTREVGHDFVAIKSFPGTRKLEHWRKGHCKFTGDRQYTSVQLIPNSCQQLPPCASSSRHAMQNHFLENLPCHKKSFTEKSLSMKTFVKHLKKTFLWESLVKHLLLISFWNIWGKSFFEKI
jgi:hypothetical protein